MEINANFLEKLKSNCKEVSIHDLSDDNTITSVFSKLVELGNEGIMVKVTWQGRTFYSFMSEDEMYKEMFGCSKEEYLESEKRRKESYEYEKQKNKAICDQAKKEKFQSWMKVIKESFPEEMYLTIKRVTESSLESGDTHRIEKMDKMVEMLQTAKSNPEKAKKLYLESAGTEESRLFNYYDLCNSYYGDVFESVMIEDVKKEYGIHGEEFVQKKIKTIKENIEKAKNDKAQQKGE